MAHYILLDSFSDANFSSRWSDSSKFLAYGRFLNKNGKFVKFSEPCTKYQVAIKKERSFTIGERVERAIEGIFYTLFTLGFSLFSNKCRKLFTDEKKVLRFAILVKDEKPELNINRISNTVNDRFFL
jgi:hypothetical protein